MATPYGSALFAEAISKSVADWFKGLTETEAKVPDIRMKIAEMQMLPLRQRLLQAQTRGAELGAERTETLLPYEVQEIGQRLKKGEIDYQTAQKLLLSIGWQASLDKNGQPASFFNLGTHEIIPAKGYTPPPDIEREQLESARKLAFDKAIIAAGGDPSKLVEVLRQYPDVAERFPHMYQKYAPAPRVPKTAFEQEAAKLGIDITKSIAPEDVAKIQGTLQKKKMGEFQERSKIIEERAKHLSVTGGVMRRASRELLRVDNIQLNLSQFEQHLTAAKLIAKRLIPYLQENRLMGLAFNKAQEQLQGTPQGQDMAVLETYMNLLAQLEAPVLTGSFRALVSPAASIREALPKITEPTRTFLWKFHRADSIAPAVRRHIRAVSEAVKAETKVAGIPEFGEAISAGQFAYAAAIADGLVESAEQTRKFELNPMSVLEGVGATKDLGDE